MSAFYLSAHMCLLKLSLLLHVCLFNEFIARRFQYNDVRFVLSLQSDAVFYVVIFGLGFIRFWLGVYLVI